MLREPGGSRPIDTDEHVWFSGMRLNQDKEVIHRTAQEVDADRREAGGGGHTASRHLLSGGVPSARRRQRPSQPLGPDNGSLP
jgi:hypothetical protein